MKKIVRILNRILLCWPPGLWRKGVTSAWFAALGLVNVVFARRSGFRNPRCCSCR